MATIYTRAAKGSALTWTEGDANIENLNTDKIEAVVDDTAPQLGGDLDVNDNEIKTTVENGSIVLRANGTGSIEAISDGLYISGILTTISNSDLIMDTNDGTDSGSITIVAGANGNIELAPNGTGKVDISGLLYPNADGTAGQVLSTDGAGNITFTTVTEATGAELENVVEDTTPQLGGNLDVAGFEIFNGVTNGDIVLTPNGVGVVILDGDLDLTTGVITTGATNQDITIDPNGTGSVIISGLTYPSTDGTNGQVLTTDGAGNLSFTTAAGGGGDLVDDTTPQLGGNLDVNGQQIVSVSNGNIVLAPNGTGMTMLNNIEYHEKIHSLGTTSGTITPNVANGNVQTITLNGNLTFSAFTSPVAGQSLTLIIKTNGTGRTLTSTMKFAGSSKVLSTTNTTDIISVFYDGTDYWASLSKGFA